jgi:hypothetical protein
MGNTNSQEQDGIDYFNIQSEIIIQRQSEFEHWKRQGNEMAVSALQNSDSLSWFQLEQKLKNALEYYNKTPSFELLYTHEDKLQHDALERYKLHILNVMNAQSYYGFNYLEEILRVSKNKAVCLRALI